MLRCWGIMYYSKISLVSDLHKDFLINNRMLDLKAFSSITYDMKMYALLSNLKLEENIYSVIP